MLHVLGPYVTGIPEPIPIEFAKRKERIWSNRNDTIEELPDFLEGTILFQLPFETIPKGTSLSITSDECSEVFIACEENGDREIFEKSLTKLRWKKKVGNVRITRSNINTSKQLVLSTIWHRSLEAGGTTLPPVTIDKLSIAVFIKEGRINILLIVFTKVLANRRNNNNYITFVFSVY